MSDSRGLRAADSDRERTAEQLRVHCGAGRITAEEPDDRPNASDRRRVTRQDRRAERHGQWEPGS